MVRRADAVTGRFGFSGFEAYRVNDRDRRPSKGMTALGDGRGRFRGSIVGHCDATSCEHECYVPGPIRLDTDPENSYSPASECRLLAIHL